MKMTRLALLIALALTATFADCQSVGRVAYGDGVPGNQTPDCSQTRAYINSLTGDVYVSTGSPCAWQLKNSANAGVADTTISVGTTAVPANSCLPSNTTYNTVTMSGLTAAMAVTGPTPAASVASVTGFTPASTGQLYFVVVPTAGTLDWQICNPTNAGITPSSSTTWNIGAR
jgi:hypothetical protein